MARTSAWRSGCVVALLAAVAGCGSDITSTGRCPELCPSSSIQLADTLLTAPVASDTSVRGYVQVNQASFLLASSDDSLKSLVLMRFLPVPTYWVPTVGDTVQVGAVDSVRIVLTVGRRDTAAKALKVVFYRLPAQFDTMTTYALVQPYFADSTLLDTAAVDDSVIGGSLTLPLPDSLRALPADTGVLALGMAVVASSPTKFAVASGNGGSTAPILEYYVHGAPPRDSLTRLLTVVPSFVTFVMSPEFGQPASGVIAVGGIPTARATLRLALPQVVVDSNAIVRATLMLNTLGKVVGFPRDSFLLEVDPILRDYGPKSMLYPDTSIAGIATLHEGQTGQVEVDITPILRLWGTMHGDSLPRIVVLRMYPEGSTFGAVDLDGTTGGTGAPQLRVTYVRRYNFGVP
jgi:hypothetical protein